MSFETNVRMAAFAVGLLLAGAACSSSSDAGDVTGSGGHPAASSGAGGAGRGATVIGTGGTDVVGTGGAPPSVETGGAPVTASGGAGGQIAVAGTGGKDVVAGTGGKRSGTDAGTSSSGGRAGGADGGAVDSAVADRPATDAIPMPVAGAIMRGDAPTMSSASTKGPYTVKTYTSGYKDEPGFGAATIYYPTDADAPFGAVAICPGFTATQSSINTWGPFLASHGIVVMTIDTNSTSDSVDQRSTALMDALDCLKAENTRAGGPLMGKLDIMRMGLMGWSMGGGATWVDANVHPELRTAITLAGHIVTATGGSAAITKIAVPTLMFAGQTDSAILGGGMSQPIYTQIPDSVPKMLYEVSGAGHDAGNNPANNGKNIGLYGLSWQKVFLEGDTRYRQFLLVPGPNASDFRTNVK